MRITDNVFVVGRDADCGGLALAQDLEFGKDAVQLRTAALGELSYAVARVFRPVERVTVVAVAGIIR